MLSVQSPLWYARLEAHELWWSLAQRQPPGARFQLLVGDVGPTRRESYQLIPSWLTADIAVEMNDLQFVGYRQLSLARLNLAVSRRTATIALPRLSRFSSTTYRTSPIAAATRCSAT